MSNNLCDTDQQDDENFNNAINSVEGEKIV